MMQQVQTARPAQPAKTLKPPRPPLGLTRAQTRCLDAIREAIARTGIAPSYTELKATLGLKSKSHIHQLVTQLEIRGAILRRIGSARSITLTRQGTEVVRCCPHCGKHAHQEKKL